MGSLKVDKLLKRVLNRFVKHMFEVMLVTFHVFSLVRVALNTVFMVFPLPTNPGQKPGQKYGQKLGK